MVSVSPLPPQALLQDHLTAQPAKAESAEVWPDAKSHSFSA